MPKDLKSSFSTPVFYLKMADISTILLINFILKIENLFLIGPVLREKKPEYKRFRFHRFVFPFV